MASKFFAQDSQPESEVENEVQSEKSQEEREEPVKKFIYESSSDDDVKRTVRSEKDKRYEALRTVINRIKDKMKIDDFVTLVDEFDELNKQLEKSKKVVEKEGVPLFYTRICYVLENYLNNLPKEKKNNLKSANNKAYNSLKHKVKKNNKNYEEEIKKFSEKPVYSDEVSSEDEPVAKKGKKNKGAKKEEKNSGWETSSEGSIDGESEPDEEEDIREYLKSNDPMVRRNYWLKRDKPKQEPEPKPEPETKPEDKKPKPAKVKADVVVEKRQLTLDELDKRVVEIVERRAGRKVSTKDKKVSVEEDLEALVQAYDNAQNDEIKRLGVLLILMPTRLDYSRQISQYCMPRDLWLENFENLQEFFKTIKNKKNNLNEVRTFQKDGENFYKEGAVVESFSTHFDGLDNELHKAFKTVESFTPEYAERLRDYAQMIKLTDEAYNHFKNAGDDFHTTKFAQKKLEYVYYMPDKLYEKLKAAASERGLNTRHEFFEEKSSESMVHEVATKVYTSNDNKLIIKTLLYHIYHHAINGRFHTAKEYFLMSHIPEIVPNLDPNTQILYNRTLIQLGLCAFSHGFMQECVNSLGDLIGTQRIRELIGQGISKMPVNEKEERRRLLPDHMHINVELIDAVHLIAAMLIEVPNIIVDPFETLKKMSSKVFRRQWDQYKNFYGPPETYRDRIMAASKELYHGNWRKCYEYLLSANIWGKLTQDAQTAKANLLTKVKEQAFKCYLFTLQNCYDSIDIHSLAKQFELENDYVHSIISKLIFNREITGYLDSDSHCLKFEKADINKLESKALTLADRVSTLLVNNEKIMDSKYGNYGITDNDLTDGIKKRLLHKKKMNTILNKDKRKTKTRKN